MTTDDGSQSDSGSTAESEPPLPAAEVGADESVDTESDHGDHAESEDLKKTLRRTLPPELAAARAEFAATQGDELAAVEDAAEPSADDDGAQSAADLPPPKPPPKRTKAGSMPPGPPPARSKAPPAADGVTADRRPLPPRKQPRPQDPNDGDEQPGTSTDLDPPTVRVDRLTSDPDESPSDDDDRAESSAPPGIPALPSDAGEDDEDPEAPTARKSSRGKRKRPSKRKRGSRRRQRRTLKIPDDEVPATPAPAAPAPSDPTEQHAEENGAAATPAQGEPGAATPSAQPVATAGTEPTDVAAGHAASESGSAVEVTPQITAETMEPESLDPDLLEPESVEPDTDEAESLAPVAMVPPVPPGSTLRAPIPPPRKPPPPPAKPADTIVSESEDVEIETTDAAGELDIEALELVEAEADSAESAAAAADLAAASAAHSLGPAPTAEAGAPVDLDAATREFPKPPPPAEPTPEGVSSSERPTPVPTAAEPSPATAAADAAVDAPSAVAGEQQEPRPTDPAPPPDEPALPAQPAAAEAALAGVSVQPPATGGAAAETEPARDDGPSTEPTPSEPPPSSERALTMVTDQSVGVIMPVQVSSDLPAVEPLPKKHRPLPPRRKGRPDEPLEELEPEPLTPAEMGAIGDGATAAEPSSGPSGSKRPPPPPKHKGGPGHDGTAEPGAAIPPAGAAPGATPSPAPVTATTPSPSPPPAATTAGAGPEATPTPLEVPPPAAEAPVEAKPPPAKPKPAPKRKKVWWVDLFDEDWLRTMDPTPRAEAEREISFIERRLRLQPASRVLDLGCGAGRHAVELAARGYQVVGVDLSAGMLNLAADYSLERGQRVNFVKGDMRKLSLDAVFDGIYCWNSTFGYFDDQTNINVLESIHRALRPGGMFALDVTNRDFVAPRSPTMVWFEQPGCVCMDEMKFDFFTSRMVIKRMVLFETGKSKELEYSIRLYTLHELGRVLHQVGFKVLEVSGHRAHPGAYFGSESPRTIVAAERI